MLLTASAIRPGLAAEFGVIGTAFHVTPLSVERYTPAERVGTATLPPRAAAKIRLFPPAVEPVITTSLMWRPPGRRLPAPAGICVHAVFGPDGLGRRNRPALDAAHTTAGSSGSCTRR